MGTNLSIVKNLWRNRFIYGCKWRAMNWGLDLCPTRKSKWNTNSQINNSIELKKNFHKPLSWQVFKARTTIAKWRSLIFPGWITLDCNSFYRRGSDTFRHWKPSDNSIPGSSDCQRSHSLSRMQENMYLINHLTTSNWSYHCRMADNPSVS